MNEPIQVTESPKSGSRIQDMRTTYFLMMPDAYETNVGIEYVKSKYPNSQARRVNELRVDRITDVHHVIVLVRPRPTAGATPRRNAVGLIEYEHHEPITKIGEIRESKPIAGKTFWRAVSNEWEGADGELDLPNFLQAISTAASPITIHWQPSQSPGILRLSWV